MRAPISIATVLLALILSCAHAESPLRTVELAELQRRDSFDMEAARAWKLPAQVTFALDGGAVIEADSVRLTGWLTNASTEPQFIVIFPVGTMGFLVQPAPGTAKRRPGPPTPPPAPPPPLTLILPAQSRFHAETVLSLAAWEWEPGKPQEIEWSFQFWNEPKPRGRLLLP